MKIKEYKVIKKDRRKYWDSLWKEYKNRKVYLGSLYSEFKKTFSKDKRILEAGCGLGQWVYVLDKEGYNIEGVDNASQTVKFVKRKYPHLKIKLADVRKLKYKRNYFDGYLSFGVVEHFEEGPQEVLKEANRILKKGGRIFLTVPYINKVRFIKYLFGFTPKKNKNEMFYQYLYSKSDIKEYVAKAGFRIIRTGPYDFISGFKRDFPTLYGVLFKKKVESIIGKRKEELKRSKPLILKPKKSILRKIMNMLAYLDGHIILIIAEKK